ncbi:MAG: hypothetical protein JNM93_10000 [Bacteriovoracaceae bacterium]|nr:hypothetical protein [Bacteriovoracaceae bacterium]
MTYCQIATIAKCSSGVVSTDLWALKAEKLKVIESQIEVVATPSIAVSQNFKKLPAMIELEFPIEEMKIELDFAS